VYVIIVVYFTVIISWQSACANAFALFKLQRRVLAETSGLPVVNVYIQRQILGGFSEGARVGCEKSVIPLRSIVVLGTTAPYIFFEYSRNNVNCGKLKTALLFHSNIIAYAVNGVQY